MNVGRFEEKGGGTILADTSLSFVFMKKVQITKNLRYAMWPGIRENPRSSRRAGVIITMKSGGHRRGLLISTKH